MFYGPGSLKINQENNWQLQVEITTSGLFVLIHSNVVTILEFLTWIKNLKTYFDF